MNINYRDIYILIICMTTFLLINNHQYVKYLLPQVISRKQIEGLDYYLLLSFNSIKQIERLDYYFLLWFSSIKKIKRLDYYWLLWYFK